MEKWFDPTVYMQNKLAQMQATDPAYTMSDLVAAFADAGFVGEEGYFQHFLQFGAAEEVAPNAYFNANEYYAAKAAQFYGEAFTGSELQIAQVKTLINKEGMNAWTHYQQFGSAEGVNPSNAFDASDYCAAKAEAMNAAGQKDPDGNDWTAESIAKAIDDAGMSVLEHYLTYAGTDEGEVAAGSTFPVSDDDQVVVPSGETIVIDELDSTIAYTGSAGDDKFYLKNNNTGLHAYNTLDGGEGNDTLILDGKDLGGATIRNIENLVVNSGNGADYDMSLFATSFTLNGGRAQLTNVAGQKLVTDNATSLTVNMAAGQASVDLASLNRDSAAQAVVLHGDSLSSVKLAVDEGAHEVGFAGSDANVTDLAITATVSEAENDVAEVNAEDLDELANVTVAGDGAVELAVADGDKLKAVNAAENTGGVTVDLSGADNAAFTGGAGADKLTVEGSKVAHTLGAGDDTVVVSDATFADLAKGFSVDGGEGTDTLQMSATLAANFKTADVATNFEILQLVGGTGTVNMDNFGDIDHVAVGALNGAVTLNNMGNGGLLEYVATPSQQVTVNVKGAGDTGSTNDVLNVTISDDNAVAANTLTVANVETINITADDTDLGEDGPVQHSMTLTAGAATAVNISGDAELVLTLTDSNKITKIDASGNTGGLTVDLTNITNDNAFVTLTGSSADDTITMGIGNVITGGEGKDAFTATQATGANATVSYSTIMDFEVGDTLTIGSRASDVKKVVVTEEMTFDQAVSTALAAVSTEVAWFEYKGNTYVVADNDGSGDTFGANDYIVKLNGIVDLSDADVAGGVLSLPEGA
ncbi:hypothetical protein [Desulfovibrio piger]|uniref:hypothetical protein n=1 Tax=Desulfovibrio piger TaxID=901 RepID=UPI001D4DC006|nr:hypothetical protein [Desulfovibrio piger]HJG34811.1 hypothetical protein [Desulfovibrio piger]